MNIGGESGDIVDEILSRLPVKSLVRFKVVCKDWYIHINSECFIAKHLKKNQTTNAKALIYHNQGVKLDFVVSICNEEEKEEEDDDDDSQTLFHQLQQYYTKAMPSVYSKNYDSEERHFSFLQQSTLIMPFHYLMYYSERVQLLGTCNGLVCLDFTAVNGSIEQCAYNRIITLWNPTTRDLKTLPSWEPQTHPDGIVTIALIRACDHIAFGFDSTSNDYKVIRVVHSFGDQCIKQAMIYSLNTNSWRELDYSNVSAKMHSQAKSSSTTIFLGEKVYWLISSFDVLSKQLLLSFDMGKEVFQFTSFPSECMALQNPILYPPTNYYTLHDSVALVITTSMRLKIWSTKELGQGRASWIKVLDIGLLGISRPLGFWKCKNSEDYLFLFTHYYHGKTDRDRNENAMKGIYLNNQDQMNMVTVKVKNNIVLPLKLVSYVESLVSVNRS